MSTFLEICKGVERESGTVDSSALIGTVVGAASRRLKVVNWVQEAWTIIQGARADWRFMRREYDAVLTIGTARYTGSALAISRFAYWYRDQDNYRPHAILDPAIGAADSTPIYEIDWNRWRSEFGRGLQTPGRPAVYAISPDDELCLGPVPDKAYALSGEYYRAFQSLVADADVPEMPALHHLAIQWRALMLLGDHDEAPTTINTATGKFVTAMSALIRDQVDRPRLTMCAAIA